MNHYHDIGLSKVIETKESQSYRYVKAIFVQTETHIPFLGKIKEIKKEFELEVVSNYKQSFFRAGEKEWTDYISIKDGAHVFGNTNIALHSLFELNKIKTQQ